MTARCATWPSIKYGSLTPNQRTVLFERWVQFRYGEPWSTAYADLTPGRRRRATLSLQTRGLLDAEEWPTDAGIEYALTVRR